MNKKYLKIEFETKPENTPIAGLKFIVKGKTLEAAIDMSTQNVNEALRALLKLGTIKDIQIFDESLEEVILQIYKDSKNHESP